MVYPNSILLSFHQTFRWREALATQDRDGYHPMEKLIAVAPSVAEFVLDKCISQTKFELPNGNYGTKVRRSPDE